MKRLGKKDSSIPVTDQKVFQENPVNSETAEAVSAGRVPKLRTGGTSSGTNPERFMNFWDHIDELRSRVMRCAYVFLAGFLVAYFFVLEPALNFLRKPLFNALPPDQQKLYFTSLFENFFTHLKVAGYLSLGLVMPYFLLEIWKFVSPGLLEKERKWVWPFLLAGTIFFLIGASFAYGVVFPVGFKYFVQYGTTVDVPLLTIDAYYSLCMKLLLLFGLAFEFPVVLVLLGLLGLFDANTLRQNRRIAIIGIGVVSAVFAPPDAMSMVLLGLPLVLLYEMAIWTLVLAKRSAPKKAAAEGALESELGFPAGESRP